MQAADEGPCDICFDVSVSKIDYNPAGCKSESWYLPGKNIPPAWGINTRGCMKALRATLLFGLLLAPVLASAEVAADQEPIPQKKISTATTMSFDRTLELQGVRFHVMSAHDGSLNTLRIIPAGLEADNSPVVRTINGTVTGAEVADLDGDGSPEIYVYVASAGSGSYGSLVAYVAHRRTSLSEINLPPATENKLAYQGYMGHDKFSVVNNSLVRRFPVYRDTDSNARPTGGMRQLQYKLSHAEADWLLTLDNVIENR
jgi:hypothetical protein